MKVSQESLLLCKDIVQDGGTQLVSVFNIVDHVIIEKYPEDAAPISLVAKYVILNSKQSDSIDLTIQIRKDEKTSKPIFQKDIQIDVVPMIPFQKSGVLMDIPELNIESKGIYIIESLVDSEVVGKSYFSSGEPNDNN